MALFVFGNPLRSSISLDGERIIHIHTSGEIADHHSQNTQLGGAHSVESTTETLASDSSVWLKLSSSNLPGRPVSRYKTCSHHEGVDTPKGSTMRRNIMNKARRVLCSTLRLPAFVPPVLVIINIYLILRGHNCPADLDKHNTRSILDNDHDVQIVKREATIEDVLQEHRDRMTVVENVCEIYNQDPDFKDMQMLGDALTTPDKSLVFCDIPKVGCTYWKRIFRFINKDFEGNYHTPFDIPRIYTHFGPWNNTKIFPLSNSASLGELSKGFTFMFSRDPYTRLWSGFLDKFILPDFWWWLGTKIIKETRPNADPKSLKCGHDVTFEEFLIYTTNNLKQGKHIDKHFRPIFQLCSPCHMKFDVIGKLETFGPDNDIILRKNNLETIGKQVTRVDKDLEEIRMLVNYNFDIQTRLKMLGKNEECYDQVDIASRLWTTFQYNGYIGDDIPFPSEDLSKLRTVMEMKRAMLDRLITIRRTTKSEIIQEWKKQRRRYLLAGYRQVSEEVIEEVIATYALDFELFQYEKRPNYII